jgi:hypothetical protein
MSDIAIYEVHAENISKGLIISQTECYTKKKSQKRLDKKD